MTGAGMASDLVLGLVVGLVLAAAHLLWLWQAARRLGTQSGGAGVVIGGTMLRLAVVIAGFAVLAWIADAPGLALLAALLGFALMRGLTLRRVRRMED